MARAVQELGQAAQGQGQEQEQAVLARVAPVRAVLALAERPVAVAATPRWTEPLKAAPRVPPEQVRCQRIGKQRSERPPQSPGGRSYLFMIY